MQLSSKAIYTALFLSSLSIAHGDNESIGMGMDMHATSSAGSPTASMSQNVQSEGSTSYFAYGQHSGTIVAHIAFMTLSWCLILPAAVMLSISRSSLTLPAHILFLVSNALGLLFGIIYNSQTPDLYEHNAHHKIGWIVTCAVCVQVFLAWAFVFPSRSGSKQSQSGTFEHAAFLPIATDEHENRWSRDSGQGTESVSSLRRPSSATCESQAEYDGVGECEELSERPSGPRSRFHMSIVNRLSSNHIRCILDGLYNVIDRIILPFGFIAVATGAVTYGGIFHGNEIFNGLAHFIKGGIFFWYGILTLGRFMGAWADLGWAWNKKPPASVVGWKEKVPSGEFVESFVIWLYGVTNVFLEHLGGKGNEWSAADMEHVSISIMFFGGGLAGMLFESRRIRDALNNTLFQTPTPKAIDENWQPPRSQAISLNPMPALIILLLGKIMGSHHQDSMTSTMVHKQWGNMLVGFAIARGLTYFLLFLRPPTSYLPARPPTEIVAGFCLMSGGLIFMLSTRQVVEAMEFYELDAMFTFTVGMGFTAFIMSLVVLNITIKAWAVKRERAHKGRLFSS